MSRTSSNLMPDEVRDFLLENPDFISNNGELLEKLVPPAQQLGDKVSDFQQHMLARLQEHINSIKGENGNLIDLMQEHIQRQGRINAAVLSLLDAGSFEDTIKYITDELANALEHDAVALFFEASEGFPHGAYGGAQVVHEGFVDTLLGQEQDILFEEIEGSFRKVFNETVSTVRSQAFIRLNIDDGMPSGLLALGHRDPMYYATSIAAEQMELLGAVIERCIRKWLRNSA